MSINYRKAVPKDEDEDEVYILAESLATSYKLNTSLRDLLCLSFFSSGIRK
jgi:hypothetical protein